ncbi:hypothetical protein SD37_23365 [Amycolatopsis orientalis]|uniref:DUF418 domain-containing protein n=1 Tax=Amycolatopsis orientalis TaxID=31958 RepID=A0A193C1K7_AMYOR|nr:DUF418 domain-containing protein [Amycolatopsis orientalis]ANN18285.1 hypothetical protein SD37_23365 [Amycolatopsis orientalis]
MSQIESSQGSPPPPPPELAEPAGPVEAGPSTARLIGVDLARALAVFGMYAVHLGPAPTAVSGFGGWLLGLAEGRASALFATLAGFSLMLIAGRLEPKTGLAGRQARARIVIRAVILFAMGTLLAMTDAGTVVILAYYGVYFLLALPLLRLRAKTLAIIAAVLAVFTPLAKFGLAALVSGPIMETINAYDPLKRLSEVGVLDLLLSGLYPTITWMTFVVAGMALGRADLDSSAVRRRLAAIGAALIAFGYGVPWLLTRFIDGLREAAEQPWGRGAEKAGSAAAKTLGEGAKAMAEGGKSMVEGGPKGMDGSGWGLLLARPHSSSTFDLVGSVGIAIIVLVGATVLLSRLSWLRRLMTPVIAVGTMSLTLYVGHFLVGAQFGALGKGQGAGNNSAMVLFWFIIGATVFAWFWSRFFRRGPLEYLLHLATKAAKFVR